MNYYNVLDQNKISNICSYRSFFVVIQFCDNWPHGPLKNKTVHMINLNSIRLRITIKIKLFIFKIIFLCFGLLYDVFIFLD